MSDAVQIVIAMCITTLSITGIVAITTYHKDRFDVALKTKVKNIVESEVAFSSEEKDAKN